MADAQARVPIQVRETEWLRAVHGLGRFVFRGDAQARLAVGTALGAPLPAVTGRAFAQGPCAALSLGPDEHLFIVAESEVTTFLAELDSALANLVRTVARLAGLAAPFMPEKAAQIWRLLGNEPPFEQLAWSDLDAPELQGRHVEKPPVLFPKPAPV